MPNNGHFSGTTELAFLQFFCSGLTLLVDTGRCFGLIDITDLKYFHLFLGNLNFYEVCLFIGISYFNTWSFSEDLFWRYSNIQLQFQILFPLPDSKLEITFKSSPLPFLQWPGCASMCPVCASRVCSFLISWVNCLCLCILLVSYEMFELGLLSLWVLQSVNSNKKYLKILNSAFPRPPPQSLTCALAELLLRRYVYQQVPFFQSESQNGWSLKIIESKPPAVVRDVFH